MLSRINDKIYLHLPSLYVTTTKNKPLLTTWHKRLSHLNFFSLKQHLKRLEIKYINNFDRHICDGC